MCYRFLLVAALLLSTGACDRAPSTPQPTTSPPASSTTASTAQLRRDVEALAADAMQGRETATPGYDRAADYVARRMAAIGLQPAGDNGGWLQQVPLLRGTRLQAGARFDIVRSDGNRQSLVFAEQYLPNVNFLAADAHVRAPAVFVGQAAVAPETGHDSFIGVDVRGKIAVLFSGAPAGLDNNRRAYISSQREKLRQLVQRGAVGAVFVNTAMDEALQPWQRQADNWKRSAMLLRDADGRPIDAFAELQVVASVSAAAADALFANSGTTVAQLVQQLANGQLRAMPLPITLDLAAPSRIEPVMSSNVVGVLPGSDPHRADEHLVYTAHLDHLGQGNAMDGDAIYNGAMDNAVGVAIMLDSARQLAAEPARRKRSLLFVALTGEEQGLLGAHWLVRQPPDGRTLVGNINLDMPVLLAPSKDVVVIGGEHSSLGDTARQAAQDIGVMLSPDPFPEEVVFIRSDQYAFVRGGIPALYLDGGVVSADGQRHPELAQRKFMRDNYHQPSDDMTLPIAWDDAARLARLAARIGQQVADAAQPPQWKPGDFFGTTFAQVPLPPAEPAAAP